VTASNDGMHPTADTLPVEFQSRRANGEEMNRVRVKAMFLLMAAIACLAPGRAAFGQGREAWQKDWQKFAEAVAPYAREGVVERKGNIFEFNRIFSREVEWTGKLRDVHSNGVATFLRLEMRPIQIPLQDGGAVEVSELSISCAAKKKGCGGWSAELVGEEVVFRTRLVNRTRGVLPVVRVTNVGGEDRLVEIETDGAELVRVVPK
jgi:hypothetical protein